MYDEAERQFMGRPETDEFSSLLNSPGSDNPDSYPDRVKALALYISLANAKK
jgi:hypothetical protein